MGSVTLFILGIVLGIFCFALAISIDQIFTSVSPSTLGYYQVGLFMMGIVFMVAGVFEK